MLADVSIILMVRLTVILRPRSIYHLCVQSSCVNMFVDFGEMFFVIFGSIVLGTVIWFLLKEDPEPLLGVYSQPGIMLLYLLLFLSWCMLQPCIFICLSVCLKPVFCQNT